MTLFPETRLRFFVRACPHGDVNATDIRKTVKQHAQRNLAEKAGASDQEDLTILKISVGDSFILPIPCPRCRS
jgi:hypothetical protein